jgi:hypothetical protein
VLYLLGSQSDGCLDCSCLVGSELLKLKVELRTIDHKAFVVKGLYHKLSCLSRIITKSVKNFGHFQSDLMVTWEVSQGLDPDLRNESAQRISLSLLNFTI